MDDSTKELSVYELITRLSERILTINKINPSYETVKQLRRKSYEILLSKKVYKNDSLVCLENTSNTSDQLLAWQYLLTQEYNLRDHAENISKCVDSLNKSIVFNKDMLRDILHLLLELKQIPDDSTFLLESNIHDTQNKFFKHYDASKFMLPDLLKDTKHKFSNHTLFLLHEKKTKRKSVIKSLETIKIEGAFSETNTNTYSTLEEYTKHDEEYESSDNYDNIWEIASKSTFTNRRTWETLGNPTPEKELPFLTEVDSHISSLVHEMHSLKEDIFTSSIKKQKNISHKQFIRDVKNILVGIVSNTFVYNADNKIILAPGVITDGISNSSIETYSKSMIFCGTCYKALNGMTEVNPYTGKHKQDGNIFAELCESIKRYLSYYRIAALSLPESHGMLALQNHIRKLSSHLHALSSICKVGPFAKSQQIPHGVALLNYLYVKVLGITNKDIIKVLYSVLYPCLQVYFNLFLRQWILEGCLIDPFNEFFITLDPKYLGTRGRTYWTRSFKVRNDIIPIFISDLQTKILNCGKAMNLLKLCVPNSPTCKYLSGKKPNLLQCCTTSEQLKKLENNVCNYYLEVVAESGPRFSMQNLITRSHDEERIFLDLVSAKRTATLKRIEMEKLKKVKECNEKKIKEMEMLKEQYDQAMKQKEANKALELEHELQRRESIVKLQKLEEQIIQEEAENLIKYYDKLFEESDKKRESIKRHIDVLNNIHLNSEKTEEELPQPINLEPMEPKLLSSKSLDIINANIEIAELTEEVNDNVVANNDDIVVPAKENEAKRNKIKIMGSDIGNYEPIKTEIVNKPMTDAQKNKRKVMEVEMGIYTGNINEKNIITEPVIRKPLTDLQRNKLKVLNQEMGFGWNPINPIKETKSLPLTEAQINKIKVMSTEFGTDILAEPKKKTELTIMEINRNYNMSSNECFYEDLTTKNDNDYVNEETEIADELNDNYIVPPLQSNKASHLKLDLNIKKDDKFSNSVFANFYKSPNFEFHKPMSVDSTPIMEFSPRLLLSLDTLSTAASNYTDEGFDFEIPAQQSYRTINTEVSKHISKSEAETSINCVNYFIQQSILVPIMAQTELVQSELMSYFINDLNYLKHLKSLRNYFFLLDGEFSRNITESLFERLYDVDVPKDLINMRTLKSLINSALDSTSKKCDGSDYLSFKIHSVPKNFELRDIKVLDCISFTYKVNWPLNIILPSTTIAKYDEVFKFLIKLHRVTWILKNIYMELKLLIKEAGKKKPFLMLSPQYQCLQQYRHVMMHFVQTLQNFVVAEVLQPSWANFEENLMEVTNLDQLYLFHTKYIKNILFMCMLTHDSAPLRKSINNIFAVILKFYDYLRSRQWEFDDTVFIHPNFLKLETIFSNFMVNVQYLFKTGYKVARTGYQPNLVQLIDMLDMNSYYSKLSRR